MITGEIIETARMIDKEGETLFDWVASLTGGHVNRKQQVLLDPMTGIRGIYVSEYVREGETLAVLPWRALIAPQSTGDMSFCETIAKTAAELANVHVATASTNNNESRKHNPNPYAELLYKTRDGLPQFSPDAVSILTDIVGRHLPPRPERVNPHLSIWHNACGGVKNSPTVSADPAQNLKLYEHAALLVQSRADWITGSVPGETKAAMVPIYDLYNGRNGKYNNMKTIGHVGREYKIIASRDIMAGEQIYNTYGNRGTPVTFTNFGFVEDYPQRWTFDVPTMYGAGSIDFALVERDGGSDHHTNETGEVQKSLQVIWNGPNLSLSDSRMTFLTRELDRLYAVKRRLPTSAAHLDATTGQVLRYYSSLVDAMSEAIRAAGGTYAQPTAVTSGCVIWAVLACILTLGLATILGRRNAIHGIIIKKNRPKSKRRKPPANCKLC